MNYGNWQVYDDPNGRRLLCHLHPDEAPGPMQSEDGYAVGSVDGIICCWRCGTKPSDEMLFVGELANCFFPIYKRKDVLEEIQMREERQEEFLKDLQQKLEEGLDT